MAAGQCRAKLSSERSEEFSPFSFSKSSELLTLTNAFSQNKKLRQHLLIKQESTLKPDTGYVQTE